jgi:hypothetical protein
MQTAGARVLREHETEEMSREAVLLQWERKIEAAERSPSRHDLDEEGEGATVTELRPTEDATHEEPRRFERRAAELLTEQPLSERRTVTITGNPNPAPRRRSGTSLLDSQIAQPERLGLWAFLLGLFLMVVAAGTAQA